jgi:DNA repair protein SbcC/Rad50
LAGARQNAGYRPSGRYGVIGACMLLTRSKLSLMILDRFLKKNQAIVTDRATSTDLASSGGQSPAGMRLAAASTVDWQVRLQAAKGDDSALLAILRDDASFEVKMAAVGALGSEAALKLAEREHRGRDRRVHRLAKQRHVAQIALRQTREEASRMIEAAEALGKESLVPVNRLVELDQAWRGLDPARLDAAQQARFGILLTQLTALTRQRSDQTLQLQRWSGEARQALAGLHAACGAAAAGTQDRTFLAAASGQAQAVVAAAPAEVAAATALCELLRSALQTSAQLDDRLVVLEELLQSSDVAAPAPPPASSVGVASGEVVPTSPDLTMRWLQLAPLADPELGGALEQRYAQWRQNRDDARRSRRTERRERALGEKRDAREVRIGRLTSALERAEAALAAGHLADTRKHLLEVEGLLHGDTLAAALHVRLDAVRAEYARLKGWQTWGGGLVRDELVLQAEALAATTPGESGADVRKLSIKQLSEVIDHLRARWKELDRQGGATSRSSWERFDTALRGAHLPVAAHLEVQRAARARNLQARDELVAALNTVALPDPLEEGRAPDWKTVAAALERFQADWRRLGPLEHTVPHKARSDVAERMTAAVSRLEAPLNQARRAAQLDRERLIGRAKELASEVGAGAQGRDLVAKARELHAEWQHYAAAIPLARATENALWGQFKSDIDAAFKARDAVISARNAEFKAHDAERGALIERLEALGAATPPAEIKRALGEVNASWQRAGPASRADAAALDARYRSAREHVSRLLLDRAQREWHATCDALVAKLTLCEDFERSSDAVEARGALEAGWAVQPLLPGLWEQELVRRAGLLLSARNRSPGMASADETLLQLEAAFELESPPGFEAARRALKLQAMKAALEGRASAAAAPLAPDNLLVMALGRPGLDESQRKRLGKVIAAMRDRGPGPMSEQR